MDQESEPLSVGSEDRDDGGIVPNFDIEDNDGIPGNATRLYISHFLSTWNSRLFEFGAVLFLASIFPATLLPTSIYALTRSAAAIVLSPAVGRYIDRGNRLQVVRTSIGMPSLFPHGRPSRWKKRVTYTIVPAFSTRFLGMPIMQQNR
jgi:hypothetical protein